MNKETWNLILKRVSEDAIASERYYREEELMGYTSTETLENVLGYDSKRIFAEISRDREW